MVSVAVVPRSAPDRTAVHLAGPCVVRSLPLALLEHAPVHVRCQRDRAVREEVLHVLEREALGKEEVAAESPTTLADASAHQVLDGVHLGVESGSGMHEPTSAYPSGAHHIRGRYQRASVVDRSPARPCGVAQQVSPADLKRRKKGYPCLFVPSSGPWPWLRLRPCW